MYACIQLAVAIPISTTHIFNCLHRYLEEFPLRTVLIPVLQTLQARTEAVAKAVVRDDLALREEGPKLRNDDSRTVQAQKKRSHKEMLHAANGSNG